MMEVAMEVTGSQWRIECGRDYGVRSTFEIRFVVEVGSWIRIWELPRSWDTSKK